jgi:Bacterial Ig-like domain
MTFSSCISKEKSEMTNKIVWDAATKRLYETGVSQGVLYPMDIDLGTYPKGVAWNGLTTITESPSGAEANPQYADNIKYLNLLSAEQFGGTVEAFMYPQEFGICDGSAEPVTGVVLGQQKRNPFGLSYRTVLGNDAEGEAYGYKLHLIYGAQAAPSEKAYSSINDSPSPIAFSWAITTTPVPVTGYKAVSLITIDSTRVDSVKLAALETILYGTEGGADGRLPLPDEVVSVLTNAAPSALTVSTVPADDASGVLVTANIVLTFNNKIASEAIVVASAAGVLKTVSKSWDTAHKVLTLDPTTDLSASTTYIVTIAGITDVYSQTLAPSVVNFATA